MQRLVEERDTVGLRRRVNRFSGYSRCDQCLRQTVQTRRKTLQIATTKSSGLELVTLSCINCGVVTERTRTLPRLSDSSSDSGSSGGSSSGGGSGSSW